MPPRLYKITVLAGAFSWVMFGMSLGMVLRAADAGETQNRLQLILLGLWFLLGVADAWWLLRFGTARPLPPSDSAAPAS